MKAYFYVFWLFRGISSCVRRCVHKKSLQEYAVKIIDLTDSKNQISEELRSVTHNEINILKEVSGHAHISKFYESQTAIFVVFFCSLIFFCFSSFKNCIVCAHAS